MGIGGILNVFDWQKSCVNRSHSNGIDSDAGLFHLRRITPCVFIVCLWNGINLPLWLLSPCSLPVCGSDDDVPPAAHLPQNGRLARPDHLPAAAPLWGDRPGRWQGAHCRDPPWGGSATSPRWKICQWAPGAGITAVVQQHQQRLSYGAEEQTQKKLYLVRFPLQ